MIALFFHQGRANNQPEYGTAMIAAAGAFLPPVLRETVPETGSRTRFEGVGADPRDARPPACVATTLSRLLKRNKHRVAANSLPLHHQRARTGLQDIAQGRQAVGKTILNGVFVDCSKTVVRRAFGECALHFQMPIIAINS